MKKIPNNVRIGMVPRDDGALKSNEDQVTNVQEQVCEQLKHNELIVYFIDKYTR